MSQKSSAIQCPSCGKAIDVNEALSQQLADSLYKEYESKEEALQKEYEDKEEAVQREFDNKLARAIRQDRSEREQQVRERIEGEQAERIAELEQDLNKQEKQIRELNRAQSKIARLEREKESLKSELEVEMQRELNSQLTKEKANYRKTVANEFQVELAEKEQTIDQLKRSLTEARNRAEPTKSPTKGGAHEVVMVDYLSEQFPLDDIVRIGPGRRGADILQTVNTPTRESCGTIYYESKNTQRFGSRWIETLKRNMLDKGANIGVLVTKTMPKDMDQLGLKDNVWVCTLEEFKGLCLVLRESLIQISEAVVVQENRGEKMEQLYNFLTGSEFRSYVVAIVEGFTKMQTDLDREKNAMQGMWTKRERQLKTVLTSTNRMYNSIREIGGSNTIKEVPLLEFPSKV